MRKQLLEEVKSAQGDYFVYGKSVRYNNKIQNGNFATGDATGFQIYKASYTINNGVITLTSTEKNAVIRELNAFSETNHTYLFCLDVKSIDGIWSITQPFNISEIKVGLNMYIATFTSTSQTRIHIYGGYDRIGTSISFTNYMILDITDLGITTLTDFNKTDLGKLVQNRYLPYGSGIVSAESPIKFSSENLTPNNFELYYEPATPLTLRGVGDVYSELGKQDVSQTLTPSSSGAWYYVSKSGISFSETSSATFLNFKFIYGHKYFFNINSNTQISTISVGGKISGTYPSESGSTTTDGKNNYILFTWTRAEGNVDLLYLVLNVSNSITINNMLLIDLTANNLDTLTAQQFYDTYKNDFPYLASGGNIAKIKDKYQNTSGRVVRNVGTRAYQSGDENNPNYLTDGTTTLFPLATSTTEQYTSVHLPKITKKAQANGIELELQRR